MTDSSTPATGALPAALLVASPAMEDPFFERTVVLLWHHDEDGAMGVVLNRAIEQPLSDVLDLELDLEDYPTGLITLGGPVDTDSGTVVTTGAISDEEGWQLESGLAVTRSQDALIQILRRRDPLILCLGYASWGPGQLDQEIEAGGWLFAEADPELVMSAERETLYDRALASMGLSVQTAWFTPAEA